MSEQTKQDKERLTQAWHSHPAVVAFERAVADHIKAETLAGSEGLTSALQFAARWIEAHGPLPESGVLCD
jgi:hypothetical protein